MTKDQLIDKWSALGTRAARVDTWMTPCYEEEIEHGVDSDEALYTQREAWETTDHFRTFYGDRVFNDAAMHNFLGGIFEQGSTSELKVSLLDAFWEAWEDEVGAYSLIEQAVENRPRVLAGQMLAMLEVVGESVTFTEEAVRQNTPEFQALASLISRTYGPASFLLDQAYNLLDYVASEGLEDIECNYPEPDCYTFNLLYWLSSSTSNLNYVTEALREGENSIADGFDLLQHAQFLAIRDTWVSLADMLRNLLK